MRICQSPSLEQFAEWLSLTAQTFENLEPFSRNKLGKNDSPNPRSNLSQYGNIHPRYDQNQIQGTSRYVSTQDKISDMQTTSKINKESSQHQRQFKSSRNQQQQLEDQNVPQTSRASKCLFEDGNHRIYMCENLKTCPSSSVGTPSTQSLFQLPKNGSLFKGVPFYAELQKL